MSHNTLWLLLGLYEGMFIVPLEQIAANHFPHLTSAKLIRKIHDGEIKLPIVTMEASQRSAKMVDLRDLALYLDQRRQDAHEKLAKLHK